MKLFSPVLSNGLLTPRSALFLAVGFVLALALFGRSRLYYDYAWQLMSVQDYHEGKTNSPFVMRGADHKDLTQDVVGWTIGYPLAYNALGTVMTACGLSSETTHRCIAAGAVLFGVFGWYLVFGLCTWLPPSIQAIAMLLISISYNGAGMLGFMMPEVFMFATVPWQLWAFCRLMDTANLQTVRKRLALCITLGALTGIAYTFRYLTVLHGLPLLGAVTAWFCWQRPPQWLGAIAILACTAALPVAAMSALNYFNVGAINSVSDALPWNVAIHWPNFTQWLLVLTGPIQALFGASIVFSRTGNWLMQTGLGVNDYATLKISHLWLAAIPTVSVLFLFAKFAPRNRFFYGAVLGLTGTTVGLLCLYSRSGLLQPDARYSVGASMLIWPALVSAIYFAWQQSSLWRAMIVVSSIPSAIALVFALRTHQLTLFSKNPGHHHIIADGNIDISKLREEVSQRLPVGAGEIVWMCFQPGVLYVLGERHVFESYFLQPVNYHAAQPVVMVTLLDKVRVMHPTTYYYNCVNLDIVGRTPDFEHGDYEVYIRQIGPAGLIAQSKK